MRPILAAAVLAASFPCLDAVAQSTARPRPPGTSPLEAPPPLPPADLVREPVPEGELQPQVTTRTENGETLQEYRVGGRLYMMRVIPRTGRPYVLVDHRGDGQFTRQDHTLDAGVRVPQWVLLEF